MAIATIINFCSNEYRFLGPCIKEAKKFSEVIHVVVSDHFFDGSAENFSLLNDIFQEFYDIKFFIYPFFKESIFPNSFNSSDTVHIWHSASRMVGFFYLPKEIQAVLFLDADEIVEGDNFRKWLSSFSYQQYDFLKLYCYWYFRSTCYQAKTWETSPLLAKKSSLNRKLIMHKDERSGMYALGQGKKQEGILSLENLPMVHHYSWVRTEEEMLKKVRSWGHNKDRDWEKLVHEEFKKDFQGKDFVHGYDYATVAPFIELASFPNKSSFQALENVKKLDSKELFSILFGKWKKIFSSLIKS